MWPDTSLRDWPWRLNVELVMGERLLWVRVQLKPDCTRWCMGWEVKGKLAYGVGSQYSYDTSERGVSSNTTADAHTSAASSRLNWRPRRFKWTYSFKRKTNSGFCACAITFQTQNENQNSISSWKSCCVYVLARLVRCFHLAVLVYYKSQVRRINNSNIRNFLVGRTRLREYHCAWLISWSSSSKIVLLGSYLNSRNKVGMWF
jgi:hypothetical protein